MFSTHPQRSKPISGFNPSDFQRPGIFLRQNTGKLSLSLGNLKVSEFVNIFVRTKIPCASKIFPSIFKFFSGFAIKMCGFNNNLYLTHLKILHCLLKPHNNLTIWLASFVLGGFNSLSYFFNQIEVNHIL